MKPEALGFIAFLVGCGVLGWCLAEAGRNRKEPTTINIQLHSKP